MLRLADYPPPNTASFSVPKTRTVRNLGFLDRAACHMHGFLVSVYPWHNNALQTQRAAYAYY